MSLRIEIKETKFPESLLKNHPRDIVRAGLTVCAKDVSSYVRGQFIDATPKVTGLTANSFIDYVEQETDGAVGIVSSPSLVPLVLEQGAKPHFPPVYPDNDPAMGEWIRRKLGISGADEVRDKAERISAAIRKRGLPARKTYSDRLRSITGKIEAKVKRCFDLIIKKLEGR